MEPVFQNRFKITIPLLKEFSIKTTSLPAKIMMFALPVLSLYLLISVFILNSGYALYDSVLFLFIILLGILSPVITLLRANHMIKRTYERMLLNKQDDLNRVLDFTDQITLYAPSADNKASFDYTQMIRLLVGKNMYILMMPKRLGIYIPKGSLTVGSEAEFLSFIKEKCVNLK